MNYFQIYCPPNNNHLLFLTSLQVGWWRLLTLPRVVWPTLKSCLKSENNPKLLPSLDVHLGLTHISGSQLTVHWFKITSSGKIFSVSCGLSFLSRPFVPVVRKTTSKIQWFTRRTPRIQYVVKLMAMTYYAKGYKAKSAETKACGGKSKEDRVQVSKSPLLVESPRAILQQWTVTTHLKCCLPGNFIRFNVHNLLGADHISTFYLAYTRILYSQNKSRNSTKTILFKQIF